MKRDHSRRVELYIFLWPHDDRAAQPKSQSYKMKSRIKGKLVRTKIAMGSIGLN